MSVNPSPVIGSLQLARESIANNFRYVLLYRVWSNFISNKDVAICSISSEMYIKVTGYLLQTCIYKLTRRRYTDCNEYFVSNKDVVIVIPILKEIRKIQDIYC